MSTASVQPHPSPLAQAPSFFLRAARFILLHELKVFLRAGLGATCGVRVVGEERVPRRGGLIVAPIHTSFADPVVLQTYFPRRILYMMTDKYYNEPHLHPFLRFWGALVVKAQGLNKEAIRAATDALERGAVIGIFPEGALSRDGLIHDAQPGAAMIAQRAHVPILPVGFSGIERLMPPDTWRLHRAPIAICFGEPLSPEGLTRDELTARLSQALRDVRARARQLLPRAAVH